jgi:RNA polymerase sigma-70 factor (ECF subfamily)
MDSDSSTSDEMLMASVAAGQRDRLAPLIRRYANPLLTFIQRLVGDRHRSEELFQEVFFLVWNKRQQYEYPRKFRPWLFAIAANKCHEVCRLRTLPAVPLDDAMAPDRTAHSSPEDRAIATETAGLVTSAVMQLPPLQRTVVVLRVWQNLSYREIAQIVGRTEPTVRSHMHHGLAGLRKQLEPRLV